MSAHLWCKTVMRKRPTLIIQDGEQVAIFSWFKLVSTRSMTFSHRTPPLSEFHARFLPSGCRLWDTRSALSALNSSPAHSANGNILPEHNDRMTKSGDFRLGQTCRLSEMTHTSSDVQHCTTSLRSWNVSMWNQTVNLNSFLFGTRLLK